MYGTIKPRALIDGSIVGKYAGIILGRNVELIQKLTRAYPRLTETGLCNKILNEKLDELREVHEHLVPEEVAEVVATDDLSQNHKKPR